MKVKRQKWPTSTTYEWDQMKTIKYPYNNDGDLSMNSGNVCDSAA